MMPAEMVRRSKGRSGADARVVWSAALMLARRLNGPVGASLLALCVLAPASAAPLEHKAKALLLASAPQVRSGLFHGLSAASVPQRNPVRPIPPDQPPPINAGASPRAGDPIKPSRSKPGLGKRGLAKSGLAKPEGAFATSTSTGRGPLPPPDFKSTSDALVWIDRYRKAPDPSAVPAAIRAMARVGLFTGQSEAALYIGFLAGVIGANEVDARDLIAALFPMAPEHQAVIVKAIAFSGHPFWQTLLKTFGERMPARRRLIDLYLTGALKPIDKLALDAEPNLLDTLWGMHFATGKYAPVVQILQALAWVEDDENLDRLTVASRASWTLAFNAARDNDLLRLYQAQQPTLGDAAAKRLGEIIEAVELFDAERIRRQALAQIEEIRRRPPEAKRNWSDWARDAGSTAIALGCVAAQATGFAQVGAACVIGGAVYTGATKLWQGLPDRDTKEQ